LPGFFYVWPLSSSSIGLPWLPWYTPNVLNASLAKKGKSVKNDAKYNLYFSCIF